MLRRRHAIALGLLVAGLVPAMAVKLGLADQITWWHYRTSGRWPGPWPLAVGVVVGGPLACLGALALARRGRTRAALAAAVALAFAMTLCVGMLANRGPSGLWGWLQAGHGDFVRLAIERPDALDTARRYEALAGVVHHQGVLGGFAPAKPPGTYLFYVATERVARLAPVKALLSPLVALAARTPETARAPHFAAFVTVVWTLLAGLGALAVARLARRLGADDVAATLAALLYAAIPSVSLFLFHLDTVLFTPIAAWMLAWALDAVERRGPARLAFAAAAGTLGACGVFMSFGLLVPLAMTGALLAVAAQPLPWRDARAFVRGLLARAPACAAFVLAFLLVTATFMAAFGFEPLAALRRCDAWVKAWQDGTPVPLWRFLAMGEFVYLFGPPLFAVFLYAAWRALRDARDEVTPALALAGTTLVFFVAVSLMRGSTEVARLWLFHAPAMVALAALPLARSLGEGALPLVALLLGELSIALVFAPWGW